MNWFLLTDILVRCLILGAIVFIPIWWLLGRTGLNSNVRAWVLLGFLFWPFWIVALVVWAVTRNDPQPVKPPPYRPTGGRLNERADWLDQL